MTGSRCRACGSPLEHVFADLGSSPLANAYREPEDLDKPELFYPLRALVCADCFLVQLDEYETPEQIFSDYAYFSSYSTSWLEHAKRFVDAATSRFDLSEGSRVVEVASNDGYLLQYFVERGIPVLGVEPAANVAEAAEAKGVETRVAFFGQKLAEDLCAEGIRADLLVANNVLAHVPALNDFVGGLALLLAPAGTLVIEVPHLLNLIEKVQFDTIYHEHFSYFSFVTARWLLRRHGLEIFDVDEIPTHGGSLRIYAGHAERAARAISDSAIELGEREQAAGLTELDSYTSFAEKVSAAKREILTFFIERKREAQTIVAYGAPAKGNTLLNYCGIGTDFIDYTVDRSPHKQGRYLPGSRIPIKAPEEVRRTRPDIVFILPWNLKDEIVEQMSFIREWGGRFAASAPTVGVLP
jgi:SAM-dependent methyltransferase